MSSRALRGEALLIDVGKKPPKGEVQVGYMPAVQLRQSLVPAAGGKKFGVETITRSEGWRGMTHAGCRVR